MQADDHNLKITFVESPINQISGDMIFQKLQQNRLPPPPPREDNNRFQEISKRLENNIRKIQNLESKYETTSKASMNFKMLKNNLVNGLGGKGKVKDRNGYEAKYIQNEKYNGINKGAAPLTYNLTSQKRTNRFETTSRERTGSMSGSKRLSLEACLKELGQMKKTVKALKQGCKNEKFPEKSHRYMKDVSNPNCYQTSKKTSINNPSKYSYTNYRDLSNRKSSYSQDRHAFSQRKFNWIRNPQIQQFTIDAQVDRIIEFQ